MTYAEKLLDPRWQKKRLEILNRDEWTCQRCGDTETTLHVHHECYEKGVEPWDTWEYLLITLCSDCHSLSHLLKTPCEKFLWTCLRGRMIVNEEDIKRMVLYLKNMIENNLDEYGEKIC